MDQKSKITNTVSKPTYEVGDDGKLKIKKQ